MSMIKQLTAVLAIAAASAVAEDVSNYQVAQFEAMMIDVQGHLKEYMSLAMNNADFTIPSGVLSVYEQMTTYASGDDSYTSLFTEIDFAQVTTAMENLPWYSTRMVPVLESYLSAHGYANSASAASSEASSAVSSEASSAVSSETSSETSSVVSETSSVVSETSSVSSVASTASSAAVNSTISHSSSHSTSANSTAKASSTKASSTKVTSTKVSSSTSGNSTHTKNGADMLTAGMGAFVAGAVAILL